MAVNDVKLPPVCQGRYRLAATWTSTTCGLWSRLWIVDGGLRMVDEGFFVDFLNNSFDFNLVRHQHRLQPACTWKRSLLSKEKVRRFNSVGKQLQTPSEHILDTAP